MSTQSHMTIGLSVSALALLITGGILYAGPINPPEPFVGSTAKTLSEIEPRTAINAANTPGDTDSLFVITQPGSYYLTGNITGVVGKRGIELAASGVTLDLNGFEVVGVAGSLDGITSAGAILLNISIKNGSVHDWSGIGIDLGFVSNFRVKDIRAGGNAGQGISGGHGGVITNCIAYENESHGIQTQRTTSIDNCSAFSNVLDGISAGIDCTITHCVSSNNDENGILAGVGCAITSCSTYDNTNAGVVAYECCVISNTSVSFSSYGILAYSGCTILNCTAQHNYVDGINCVDGCVIRGNYCYWNGYGGGSGAGIRVTGFDCRIESNKCFAGATGVEIENPGNILLKNTCSLNSPNWIISQGNAFGPIVVTPYGVSASGNSAPDSLGTSHPNANFTY